MAKVKQQQKKEKKTNQKRCNREREVEKEELFNLFPREKEKERKEAA
jgi:hypothetical protein